MKATLILDSLGPNPAYDPPRKEDYATDEEWHDAKALYDFEPDVIIPAGTIISGQFVYAHCHPDDSNLRIVRDSKTGDKLPKRVGKGIVRAVPADQPCEVMLAKWVQSAAKKRRVTPSAIQAEIDAGVAASKALQSQLDAAPPPPPVAGKDAAEKNEPAGRDAAEKNDPAAPGEPAA